MTKMIGMTSKEIQKIINDNKEEINLAYHALDKDEAENIFLKFGVPMMELSRAQNIYLYGVDSEDADYEPETPTPVSTKNEYLINRRKASGLTQKEMAAVAKVSERVYAYIENGRQAKPEVLERLADFFNCSMDRLIVSKPEKTLEDYTLEEMGLMEATIIFDYNLDNDERNYIPLNIVVLHNNLSLVSVKYDGRKWHARYKEDMV